MIAMAPKPKRGRPPGQSADRRWQVLPIAIQNRIIRLREKKLSHRLIGERLQIRKSVVGFWCRRYQANKDRLAKRFIRCQCGGLIRPHTECLVCRDRRM